MGDIGETVKLTWAPRGRAPASSCAQDVVAFIGPGQQDVAEVDGPDAVIHLLEADDMLLEGIGQEEQALLEPDRPGVASPVGNR